MTAFVDVQLIEGLGLPYVPGAEAGLLDPALDPLFNDTWQTVVAAFPSLTLAPLFDGISVEQLADLVDGVRFNGAEPPNPFAWFTLACDESAVAAVVAAMLALPMVVFAEERSAGFVAATISYGTNPESLITLQIQPAPNGVDAIYAWQIPGGAGDGIRVADIEEGWRLDHDELLTANVRRFSVFGSSQVDHGTAVAGIVVGSDNGVGTIGIASNAEFDLITMNRGLGPPGSLPAAIAIAATVLRAGDILLLEIALPFPPAPGAGPDVLREFSRSEQAAIALATSRDITVIEPAGNAGVNLDNFAVLAHTRPGSPTFVESGAIVVGAGELTGPANDVWARTFSSFGSRVDCFAAGRGVRAPSSSATNTYQFFSGTSSASAIIAGLVASLQGMTRAATGGFFAPTDVRRLLRSASLGTLPGDPFGARIGPMPDLRLITRALGLIRVLPIGAAAIGGNALFIVHLDADNRLVRRHFTLLTGWGPPIPTPTLDGSPSPSDAFELVAAQPAVSSSDEDDPISRTVFDAFFSGPAGIHHMFWDTRNQAGNIANEIAPLAAAAQGRAVGAVRVLIDLQVIAAINPAGRLVVITGDPQILSSGMSTPLVIDPFGVYRRVDGPTIVSRAAGLADIVAIEDGGSINWFRGRLPATIGTGWSGPVTEPTGTAFDRGARPALLGVGTQLLAAAVGTDGSLRAVTIDPVAISVDAPIEVDASVVIARNGPVALGRTALNFVVLAIDTQGTLRAATRLIAGGSWTPLIPIVSPIAISPLGGVSAVTMDIGVMAIAVGVNGIICSAISVDGLIWSPLLPLP
jgi:hypothetical protein